MSEALTVPEVARAAGVEYRTLHTWLRRGLFTPSAHAGNGTGDANRCTEADLERVRWLARLRRVGLSMEGLAQAVEDPAPIIAALQHRPAPVQANADNASSEPGRGSAPVTQKPGKGSSDE